MKTLGKLKPDCSDIMLENTKKSLLKLYHPEKCDKRLK